MARPSVIAIQDIEDAVDTLNGLGKPINPYQVRTLLGKGSEAKIAYFLKGLDIDIDYQDEDPVTKRLVSLIRPVVLELNDQYDELVAKEKKGLKERLEKEKQRSEDLKKENHEAQKSHQQAVIRITELEKSLIEVNQALTDKSAKLSKTEQSNENLKQALVAAENALIEVKHHQDQLQTEHTTLVHTLKNEHAETLTGYKKALEQSNSSIQQTRDQLADAENKNKTLTETQEINSTLQTGNQKLTVENEKLRTEVEVLRSVVDKISINKK